MYSNENDEITLNWAGVSVGENGIEAIGKNIACASGWYGDLFYLPWSIFTWFLAPLSSRNPRSSIAAQNVAIKLPTRETDISKWVRGWFWWTRNAREWSGFSLSIALPLEIYLAPNQTFSAICGPYNILAIKEDGT
jgi:hypothetical protein